MASKTSKTSVRAQCLRVLRDKLWLLKLMAFLGSFEFCKIYLISWYLPQGAQTQLGDLFVNVLLYTISSWDFSHKCDISNLIDVIIHVEKTFRALYYQRCGKYVKKKQENHGTLAKKEHIFVKLKISRFQTPFTKSKTS